MDAISDLLREALVVVAVLAFPILLAATLVGVVVAVFQAATSIQEQTLSALPKIITVLAMITMFGAFGMSLCANLFRDAVSHIHELVSS